MSRGTIGVVVVIALGMAASTASTKTSKPSFRASKKLMAEVYKDHQTSFYCGCEYSTGRVDHKSCGYESAGDEKRAARIEWEHVVPAHAFGQAFREWREGHPTCVTRKGERYKGRRCARKASAEFGAWRPTPTTWCPPSAR